MTRGRLAALLLGLSVCGTSCRAPAPDPWTRARAEVERGELLAALGQLDSIPPADPRYAEARIEAMALERRVRVAHKLVVQGLALRAQWRDEEAAQSFETALEIWPDLTTAARLADATRARLAILAVDPAAGQGERVVAVETAPLLPDAPPRTDESGGAGRTEADEPPASPPGTAAAAPPVSDGEIASRVADCLERGDLDTALLSLREALEEAAEPTPLRGLLVDVLHRRALLRYGQGVLDLALADWHEVTTLDPEHREARRYERAARAEFEARDYR